MKLNKVYYKFEMYNGEPFLKTYTLSHKSLVHRNAWITKESFGLGLPETLKERDLNHVFFDSLIGAASNIYEQYLLRNQQGINSAMINKIVHWDYFQELLEEQPGIMI